MDRRLLDRIKPGNGYSIIAEGFDSIAFSLKDNQFSPELLRRSQAEWERSPGKYDGKIVGVKNIREEGKLVRIALFPMLYSTHRYIASCIKNNTPLKKTDTVFPFCVANISYISRNGERSFLMGIRKSKDIDRGKLEFIPQGFCDFEETRDLSSFILSTLLKELREEVGPDLNFNSFDYLALATDDDNSQYALLTEFEIPDRERVLAYNGKETAEHERIILIPENELELLIRNASELIKRKTGNKQRNIQPSAITKALLYCYLKKHSSFH